MESEMVSPTVLATIFVGASVILLVYILRLLKTEHKTNEQPRNEKSVQSERKKENHTKATNKKKNTESRWTGRGDKQNFSHPWLLTSLKGHTGEITGMDFSGNGKYLASCGYEDPDPGGKDDPDDSSSSKDESSQSSSGDRSPLPKGLSRRQRKNRRREDSSPSEAKKKLKPKKVEPSKKAMNFQILRHFSDLQITEQGFYMLLERYLLRQDLMVHLGYPVDGSHFDGIWIYKNNRPFHEVTFNNSHIFDVNAREFVPGKKARSCSSTDSGQGSGSSSDSGENDYEDTSSSDQESSESSCSSSSGTEHSCVRCGRAFKLKNKEYLTTEKCIYHWGKLKYTGDGRRDHRVYTCCEKSPGSRGCTEGACHVWNGLKTGPNGPFQGYVRTRARRAGNISHGIYAIDCEMCYTVAGLELTKVTVINIEGRLVYDSFVKPDNAIVDYNTRFSGITARDLKGAKCLRDVQNDLMGFVCEQTILIGHGLENDLRALKIIHLRVVDTALSFPHYQGLPYRRSLKELMSSTLHRDIQCSGRGHSSYEDASACMELMLWRVKNDFFVNRHH